MHKKIKIGIMGCAAIADRSMIPAILQLKDQFELTAIASRTLEKAKSFTQKHGGIPIEGYHKLLDADIDAIYMPLPTGLHEEWILKSLEAGKHVYAEKSFAMNHQSAFKMVQIAKEKNITLMEGFMFQYHRQHQKVLEIFESGELGELRGFRSAFGIPPLDTNNFRYDHKIGGGVLMDTAGYPLRATHFMLNKLTSPLKIVDATLYWDKTRKTYMYGSAFLKNDEGIASSIGFGFDNFYQCYYELWGSKGKLTASRAFTPRPDFSPQLIIEKQDGTQTLSIEPENHFIKSMQVFADSISGGKREKLYKEILLQSKNLDLIEYFSQNK